MQLGIALTHHARQVMCVDGPMRGYNTSVFGDDGGVSACRDVGRRSVVVEVTDSCPCVCASARLLCLHVCARSHGAPRAPDPANAASNARVRRALRAVAAFEPP